MKNKIKFYRRLAAAMAVLVVISLFAVAGWVVGNPLIELYMKSKTEKYIQSTYPQHNLKIVDCRYSGTDMFAFYFTVKDTDVDDIEFEISWHNNGKKFSDSYQYRVANMKNTYNRLSNELAKDINNLLSEYNEFTDISIAAAYGDWGQEIFTGYPESTGIYFDMPYIRDNINVPVTVYLTQKERPQDSSFETAVAIAQKADAVLQNHGIEAEYISVILSVNCGDYYCDKGGKIHSSELYSQNLADKLYNEYFYDCKQCMTDRSLNP